MPWRSYLTKRKLFYGFLLVVGIYLFNTFYFIQYLESQNAKDRDIIVHRHTDSNDTLESAKCNLGDPLITSAISRVKTDECKNSLIDVYCFHSDDFDELNNTCPQFDRSQLNSYIGCFNSTNSTATSLLTGYHYIFSSSNSPSNCVQACLRAGFEIAGVKATSHCFCGYQKDLFVAEKILDSNCKSTVCSGNHNETCGGIQATAIYSTGVEAVKRRFPKFLTLPKELGLKKSVKILFLLQLNGRNSRQVIRMLRAVYSKKHLYIVHVDSRQRFMFEEMKKLEKDLKKHGITNFKVLDERFSTIWGGTELLTMFLNVIRNSINDSIFKEWDYILNLSESDMPLLSLDELEHNLGIHNGKSFLASHGYNTADFIRKQGFLFSFHQCENRMWRIKSRENFFKNMRIDGGSDWVIVHRNLAEFAISNSIITNQILKYFSTILLPLEGFFHTLALNSQFCGSVLYKNLRLTNWRRKQGCRCAMLKPVVDWCGCSPLAFRGNDTRFEMDNVRSKTYFFARKFDSFVDVESIHAAEKQALRFHPELLHKIESSPTLNSTWIKSYDSVIDYDIPNRHIYEGIAKVLFENWIKGQSIEKCHFQKLLEIWAFKAAPESSANPILTVESSCETKFQFLVERFNRSQINPDPKMEDYAIVDADFGSGLDLKEEIFRDVLPVFDVNSKVTILLHWKQNQSYFETNYTSPFINIQWWNTVGRLVKHEIVKPYNSIFGGQYAELDLSKFPLSNDIIPGLWSARLPAKDTDTPVFEIQFPIFPSDRDSQLFEKLVKAFYAPKDVCSMHRITPPRVRLCREVLWSSIYPDIKSELFV